MKRKESLGQSYVKPAFFGTCRVPEALHEKKKWLKMIDKNQVRADTQNPMMDWSLRRYKCQISNTN